MHAQIRWSCGIGDAITYFSRIKSFKKQTNSEHVHVHVAGGWKDTPQTIVKMGEVCVAHKIIDSISTQPIANADIYEDWQPDDVPLKYAMTLPFTMPSSSMYSFKDSFPDKKICVVHPVTYMGSFEGINTPRYLPQNGWNKVCQHLRTLGYVIVTVGAIEESGYIDKALVDWNLCGVASFDETISILKTADLVVGCASWCWECSSYSGVPTVALYYSPKEYFRLHVPSMDLPCHGIPNLRVETEKNIGNICRYISEFDEVG